MLQFVSRNSGSGPSRIRRRGDAGFALIVVIWGVGLLSLICLTFVTTARWRLWATSNLGSAAQASSLAEAATNITIARLSGPMAASDPGGLRFVFDGQPLLCALPQGAIAAVAVEDEGGKVDLNGATPAILQAMLQGFGVERRRASLLAAEIIAFRTALSGDAAVLAQNYRSAGLSAGPKRGLYQSIFELDQVLGVDPQLFRTLLPFITISSGRSGVDPLLAPPALFAALAGSPITDVAKLIAQPYPNQINRNDPRFPLPFAQSSSGGVIVVHVEVILPGGQSAGAETLVDFRQGGAMQATIKEVRRGIGRYQTPLKAAVVAGSGILAGC